MNGLADAIREAAGGAAVDLLARIGGVPKDEAERMIADTVPAMSEGLKRKAQSREGVAEMVSLALGGASERYVAEPRREDAVMPEEGFRLMESLFGGPQGAERAQHAVAEKARSDTRATSIAIPVIAAAALGALAIKIKQDKGLQAKLRELLGLAGDAAGDAAEGAREIARRAREIATRKDGEPVLEVKETAGSAAADLGALGELLEADARQGDFRDLWR